MSAIAVRLYRLSAPVSIALATMVVALPLVVAVVALAQRRWVPVLDLAMTEFRVDDVGTSDTPLIGLPGRIGELPDQGSHPGPLSFWFLAPGYVLFGGSSWALEASTVLLAVAWIATALWIGHRRLGTPGVAMVAGAGAVLIRGFGLSVLTQPWNPYMPLLAWLVVLLATWAVLDGDDAMLVPLVVAASFCAQTHIPYLLMAGVMGLLAFGVAVWRAVRSGRGVPRSAKVTGGMFLVLWVGTMADQDTKGSRQHRQCNHDRHEARRHAKLNDHDPVQSACGEHHHHSDRYLEQGKPQQSVQWEFCGNRIRERQPLGTHPGPGIDCKFV
mgnify:CR=1 FL=1